jgi:hypothetical protein
MLAKAWPGLRFNEHMDGDGELVFGHRKCSSREARSGGGLGAGQASLSGNKRLGLMAAS